MKARKTDLVGLAAMALALAFGASAADVAFYPFTDGAAGSDAVGVAVQNAADQGTLPGTVSRNGEEDTATATFLDDVPGRYLYTNSAWSADAIYRADGYQSVQVTFVTNSDAQVKSSTSIDVEGLGAKLSGLDAWTVEFFFKFDVFRMTRQGELFTYLESVQFGDKEKISMCLQNKLDNEKFTSVRTYCGGVMPACSAPSLSNDGANGKELLPGIWHHVAVTYDGATRKFRTILDYTHQGSEFACTNETPFQAGAFKLGLSGAIAARFAALRVTDRVLSANELMRASHLPPSSDLAETRFHWSFEAETPGDSLGTVLNDAPWRPMLAADCAKQYAYATDGQVFVSSGDGVVTPKTLVYTDPPVGELTLDGCASNVACAALAALARPDGSCRPNTNCAFVAVGPKYPSSDTFGRGPVFTMTGTDLLTSSDFTAETYWRPDVDGWNAVLGNDAGNRYRSSVFGIKGLFNNDVPGKLESQFVWKLYFDMKATTFTCQVVTGDTGSGFKQESLDSKMKDTYLQKCSDGQMHHYAVVYRVADAENGGAPTVRLYIDHEQAETMTLTQPMVDFLNLHKQVEFRVGDAGLNDHPMQGWYDEITVHLARARAVGVPEAAPSGPRHCRVRALTHACRPDSPRRRRTDRKRNRAIVGHIPLERDFA